MKDGSDARDTEAVWRSGLCERVIQEEAQTRPRRTLQRKEIKPDLDRTCVCLRGSCQVWLRYLRLHGDRQSEEAPRCD